MRKIEYIGILAVIYALSSGLIPQDFHGGLIAVTLSYFLIRVLI